MYFLLELLSFFLFFKLESNKNIQITLKAMFDNGFRNKI